MVLENCCDRLIEISFSSFHSLELGNQLFGLDPFFHGPRLIVDPGTVNNASPSKAKVINSYSLMFRMFENRIHSILD